MTPNRRDEVLDKIVVGSIIGSGVLLLVAAPLTMCFMGWNWLQSGMWPDWSPIALGYLPTETSMLGLNKILFWIYSRQLALLSFIAGVGLLPDIDEDCVNRELAIGRSLGRFGFFNNCQTLVFSVTKKCSRAPAPIQPGPGELH
jgi:hypothetical protein